MIGKILRRIDSGIKRQHYPLDIYPGCFDERKCIYIHIPKAAGTSVSMSLFGHHVGHIPFSRFYHSSPQKALSYFKFTFVRNPWSRLVSSFFFLKAGGMNSEDKEWSLRHLGEFETFDDFVKKWVNKKNINSHVHFLPQLHFISDENGTLKVNYVGRVENLAADIKAIASRIGKPTDIGVFNQSKHDIYTKYYTPETQEIVGNVYEKDIEMFGYKFGE